MAQADCLSSAIRVPITDARPNPSTNPYAQLRTLTLTKEGVS
jgi:hypothetical protein